MCVYYLSHGSEFHDSSQYDVAGFCHLGRNDLHCRHTSLKRQAFKIAIWLGPRKQELHTQHIVIMHDEAVHATFLCFLEAYQIAILKIAFLSAGLFLYMLRMY